MLMIFKSSSYFFFQAEDGIRDGTVTGVQTCALPIYLAVSFPKTGADMYMARELLRASGGKAFLIAKIERAEAVTPAALVDRSEERRVGKECRSRWAPDQ